MRSLVGRASSHSGIGYSKEPPIVQREFSHYLERDKPWHKDRLPLMEHAIRGRLKDLSARLGDSHWLDGTFSAGDLLTVQLLRRL